MATPNDERDAERFRRLFDEHGRDVNAYVLRRAEPGLDAADVVADTFTTIWRRIREVPAEPEARAYIFGVVRRALANAHRGELRRGRLLARLGQLGGGPPAVVPDHANVPDDVAACRAALARLRPPDREVLQLVAWEGLTPKEVAAVLGCGQATARMRLTRARRRLRRLLTELSVDPGPAPPHRLPERSPEPTTRTVIQCVTQQGGAHDEN